ncbi:amidohydrolase [Paenibacillus algorifonticola]|uniref:Amidohydrolase n=1 Tax=Paenibacillus algorifonticola TaxID=684063 RepID=A0A1I2BWZ8_9BACL|nr:amidohydrolase [Paenibacillus algorifonticola]SFE60686.1 amidohydrolase [Paenibacillus algorifonticola]
MNAQAALSYVDTLREELIALRRDFHKHPEVLFEVDRTAEKVAAYLSELGLQVQQDVGKHFGKGVVGVLTSDKPGPTIVLRADMDALAIAEGNTFAYRSSSEGAMHACGHDAHMTMLLGAAKALSRHRDIWSGTIKFVFQPAEESALPSPIDGRMISGGRDMIEAGVLEGVDLCFAIHVWPELPTGVVGIHRKEAMAASSHFHIAFQGVNGHHSTPHLAVDALSMAVQFISDVKFALAAEIDPWETKVFAFGTLHAGTAINAIAGESKLSGTYRVFHPELTSQIHQLLEKRADAVASTYGGSYTSQYRLGTPLLNDASAVQLTVQAGRIALGDDKVVILDKPSLAGEDFALYVQEVPGAFAFIGIANPSAETVYPLHHPLFDMDEEVLTQGAKLFVQWVQQAGAEYVSQ